MEISKAINILILVLTQLNVYGLTNHLNFTQSDGEEFNINKNIVSFNIIKDYNNLYDLNFSQDKLDEQLSQPDNSSTFAITPGITPVDPGTGGGSTPTNTSFSSAYELTLNNFIGLYVSAGTAQYFKIQRNQLDYISLYTQGNYDTRVIIYDENYNMIDMNDDVENNNYYNGIHNTTNPNCFLNFYADKNKLYYVKIELTSPSDFGSFSFHAYVDNWSLSQPNDLLGTYDGVIDNSKLVKYKIESQYVNEINASINEWEKLNSITFSEVNLNLSNVVEIIDYIDSNPNSAFGKTTVSSSGKIRIMLNTYHFSQMNSLEKQKTIMHEIGHVLGFKEFSGLEYSFNVMVQGKREQTELGPADILAYRTKWG